MNKHKLLVVLGYIVLAFVVIVGVFWYMVTRTTTPNTTTGTTTGISIIATSTSNQLATSTSPTTTATKPTTTTPKPKTIPPVVTGTQYGAAWTYFYQTQECKVVAVTSSTNVHSFRQEGTIIRDGGAPAVKCKDGNIYVY